MSRHDPLASVRDMLDYALKAIRFCADKSFRDLEQDEILQLAVVRALELVGEAAARVPEDVRELHPTIPWRDIVATRNRLIHGYDRVDLHIVWDTVSTDLPPLADQLRRILGDDRAAGEKADNWRVASPKFGHHLFGQMEGS